MALVTNNIPETETETETNVFDSKPTYEPTYGPTDVEIVTNIPRKPLALLREQSSQFENNFAENTGISIPGSEKKATFYGVATLMCFSPLLRKIGTFSKERKKTAVKGLLEAIFENCDNWSLDNERLVETQKTIAKSFCVKQEESITIRTYNQIEEKIEEVCNLLYWNEEGQLSRIYLEVFDESSRKSTPLFISLENEGKISYESSNGVIEDVSILIEDFNTAMYSDLNQISKLLQDNGASEDVFVASLLIAQKAPATFFKK